MNTIICVGRISEYLEEEYVGRSREKRIWNKTIGEFLADLKKKFGEGDNEIIKVVELKRKEQGSKMVKEFVQKFRRVARSSGYKRRLLVKEFKRRMNGVIRRKLMKAEYPPRSIEQWYERLVNLDRH